MKGKGAGEERSNGGDARAVSLIACSYYLAQTRVQPRPTVVWHQRSRAAVLQHKLLAIFVTHWTLVSQYYQPLYTYPFLLFFTVHY
jgi:hypothetical protein